MWPSNPPRLLMALTLVNISNYDQDCQRKCNQTEKHLDKALKSFKRYRNICSVFSHSLSEMTRNSLFDPGEKEKDNGGNTVVC